MREIDMGTDRELFSQNPDDIAVYEGRMVGQYDHRAKAYRSGRGRSAVWEALLFGCKKKSIGPQWHIPPDRIPDKARTRIRSFRIGFCDVASPANERTLVATVVPPGSICGHSLPTITFDPGNEWAYLVWVGVANSFVMDFLARQKVSLHMTFTITDSLPFPWLEPSDARVRSLAKRVLRLICTGPEMIPLWNSIAKAGFDKEVSPNEAPPCFVREDERLAARAQVDAIVARDLFGLLRTELDYILDTFPIVRKRDEKAYGEHRTKRLILEYYDNGCP